MKMLEQEFVCRVCMHFKKAVECYRQTCDIDMAKVCSHALALVHDSLGDVNARDSAAKEWLSAQLAWNGCTTLREL